jgi:hypothetical protein
MASIKEFNAALVLAGVEPIWVRGSHILRNTIGYRCNFSTEARWKVLDVMRAYQIEGFIEGSVYHYWVTISHEFFEYTEVEEFFNEFKDRYVFDTCSPSDIRRRVTGGA